MNTCISTDKHYNHPFLIERSDEMYAKEMPLSFDDVNDRIAYDPLTGVFTWKVSPNRRTKAGAEAGGKGKSARRNKKTGAVSGYRYINVLHYQTPAARVAWLLTYGVWPKGNILFKDNDSTNLRIDNLKEGDFPTIRSVEGGRRHYKMTTEATRHYGLKRYYGMSLETYNTMLAGQGGVCAICKGVETYIPKGRGTPKPLSVDHNHATGAIRGLLCSHCNYVIGYARENIETLRETIKYLEKHAAPAPMPEDDVPSEVAQGSEEIH
jgi:hypothetical protein